MSLRSHGNTAKKSAGESVANSKPITDEEVRKLVRRVVNDSDLKQLQGDAVNATQDDAGSQGASIAYKPTPATAKMLSDLRQEIKSKKCPWGDSDAEKHNFRTSELRKAIVARIGDRLEVIHAGKIEDTGQTVDELRGLAQRFQTDAQPTGASYEAAAQVEVGNPTEGDQAAIQAMLQVLAMAVKPPADDAEAKMEPELLGHGYARDGQHVLFDGKRIDPEGAHDLKRFARTWSRELRLASNVDAASFKALSEEYTKDKDMVYYKWISPGRFWVVELPEADPKSFESAASNLAKDHKHVRWYGDILKGLDPKTLEVVNANFVWKNRDSVWYQHERIADADPQTFTHIGQAYYRDKNRVYWGMTPLDGADPTTFRSFGDDVPYGADRNSVWRTTETVPKMDPATFGVVHQSVYKDKTGVYCSSLRVPGARPETTRMLADLNEHLTALLTDGEHHFVFVAELFGGAESKLPAEDLSSWKAAALTLTQNMFAIQLRRLRPPAPETPILRDELIRQAAELFSEEEIPEGKDAEDVIDPQIDQWRLHFPEFNWLEPAAEKQLRSGQSINKPDERIKAGKAVLDDSEIEISRMAKHLLEQHELNKLTPLQKELLAQLITAESLAAKAKR